jgi:hypothetical protein
MIGFAVVHVAVSTFEEAQELLPLILTKTINDIVQMRM